MQVALFVRLAIVNLVKTYKINCMKILNIMLTRQLGGIEQAFTDYDQALAIGNHEILNIVRKNAKIIPYLKGRYQTIANRNKLDVFSIYRLKKIIEEFKPDVIITHGNRATFFAYYALKFNSHKAKLVAVAHNYTIKYLPKADYILAITERQKRFLAGKNLDPNKIFVFHNIIHVNNDMDIRPFKNPPIIGLMGRFEEKKGMEFFIKAIAEVIKQGYDIKAVIGGGGEYIRVLKQEQQKLELENYLEFIGWVQDKEQFFKNIDIFCIPSLEEPFGIVMLEAMKFSVPIIATKTEGPLEVLTDRKNALLCEIGSSNDMAAKIIELLNNNGFAQELTKNAYETVMEYDIHSRAQLLTQHLTQIIGT